ncbi:hypothetical protein EG327_005019 [Venturia inaequalis]|uniref:Uncharacterized protein n=1 Tax=Venturia inaequalis TaxID=5025 RepID=A0A8H3Z8M0_VENIN|nr:hypothetical protein EG327_005019 [Venturia inaequalis]
MPEPNLLHRLWASTTSFLAQPPPPQPPAPQQSTITSWYHAFIRPSTDLKIDIILTLLLALFLLSTLLILLLSKLIHTSKSPTLTHLDIYITDRLDYVSQDRHKIQALPSVTPRFPGQLTQKYHPPSTSTSTSLQLPKASVSTPSQMFSSCYHPPPPPPPRQTRTKFNKVVANNPTRAHGIPPSSLDTIIESQRTRSPSAKDHGQLLECDTHQRSLPSATYPATTHNNPWAEEYSTPRIESNSGSTGLSNDNESTQDETN